MRKLVGILSAALLVTAVMATNFWLQLRDERALSAALQASIDTSASTRLEQAPPAAPDVAARPQPAPATPPPATPAQPAVVAAEKQAFGERMLGLQTTDRDLRRAQMQRTLVSLYPDLGAELHLSPEEVNKLLELIATQQVENGDAFRAAADRTNPTAASEAQRKAMAAPQSNAAQLAALLGAKYPQWQEYEKALPSRRQVNELQTLMGSGANALGAAQARPLIAALSAERARINQEQSDAMVAGADPREMMRRQMDRTETNRRLLDAAAPHLTAQQLDGYKRMLDRDAETARHFSALMDEASATPAAVPAPR